MGGRGSAGGVYAGVTVNIGRKQKTYFLRNGKLQDSQSLQFIQGDGKSLLNKLVQSGGKPLSKKQVGEIVAKSAENRANVPDYELGNPFNEKGKKKLVYRPRRRSR